MPKVTHVKKARKAIPEIGVWRGDIYYHWSRMIGGRGQKFKSKTPPTRQQLTGSPFMKELFDLEDRQAAIVIGQYESTEDCAGDVEVLSGEISALADDTQASFENMPEGLQQGDTGQLLEERAAALEAWTGELESLDAEQGLDDYMTELENITHEL